MDKLLSRTEQATVLPTSSSVMTSQDEAETEAVCEREWRFIINTLAAGALCAVGLVGNGASYRVLGRDTEILPVPRFLLRSLALADNAFLLVWFANFSLWDLVAYVGLDRMSAAARASWMYVHLAAYPLGFICQTATIWLTVLVAASRCLAVCCPAKAGGYCTLEVTRLGQYIRT